MLKSDDAVHVQTEEPSLKEKHFHQSLRQHPLPLALKEKPVSPNIDKAINRNVKRISESILEPKAD